MKKVKRLRSLSLQPQLYLALKPPRSATQAGQLQVHGVLAVGAAPELWGRREPEATPATSFVAARGSHATAVLSGMSLATEGGADI